MGLKKLLVAVLLPILCALSACSAPAGPVDLTGTWSSPSSEGVQFVATIGTGQIEMHITADDTKGLYWKGTFPVPDQTPDGAVITSAADTEALSGSLLGSQDASKDFTYSGGSLRFDFTMMGVTKTVSLSKG